MQSSIVFGRDPEERIVAVEPEGELAEIFTQELDGSITSRFVKNEYWILSHNKLSDKWVRLKGDNHYKWGRKFSDRQDFLRTKGSLRNQDVFSVYDPKESFLIKTGRSYFKGLKHTDVSILSFDIETDGLYKTANSRVFLISNTYRGPQGIQKKLFCYDDYKTDGDMIAAWCAWVREVNPTILTGHNINGYDLPYLEHVAAIHNISLLLGRDGSKLWFNSYESKFRKDQTQNILYYKPNCYGRNIVDTLFLAIKADAAAKKYESYALKYLSKVEELQGPNRTFYDASKIRYNYKDPIEWEKIKEYAKDDSDEALGLYDIFCPALHYFTQYSAFSFQRIAETATGSQLNSILLRAYIQDGYSIPKATQISSYEGGYSLGIPGIYRNCFKTDLQSAYPHTIIQYNLYDREKDPNAIFLKMTEYLTNERLKNKKLAKETGLAYYKYLESSQKIGINSLYGLCGTNGLNFNSPAIAATITKKCKEYLEKAILWATSKESNYWESLNNKEMEEK